MAGANYALIEVLDPLGHAWLELLRRRQFGRKRSSLSKGQHTPYVKRQLLSYLEVRGTYNLLRDCGIVTAHLLSPSVDLVGL